MDESILESLHKKDIMYIRHGLLHNRANGFNFRISMKIGLANAIS